VGVLVLDADRSFVPEEVLCLPLLKPCNIHSHTGLLLPGSSDNLKDIVSTEMTPIDLEKPETNKNEGQRARSYPSLVINTASEEQTWGIPVASLTNLPDRVPVVNDIQKYFLDVSNTPSTCVHNCSFRKSLPDCHRTTNVAPSSSIFDSQVTNGRPNKRSLENNEGDPEKHKSVFYQQAIERHNIHR